MGRTAAFLHFCTLHSLLTDFNYVNLTSEISFFCTEQKKNVKVDQTEVLML